MTSSISSQSNSPIENSYNKDVIVNKKERYKTHSPQLKKVQKKTSKTGQVQIDKQSNEFVDCKPKIETKRIKKTNELDTHLQQKNDDMQLIEKIHANVVPIKQDSPFFYV